nr:LTA synthase family protein [uncultured Desulfobulbus sp.]
MAAESFIAAVWLPILTGLLASFPIEALVKPGVAGPWRRPLSSLALHCGLWLAVYSFELAVFQRPWFAAFVALSFLVILVLVNNAKFDSLHEPFFAQDFEYFLDTIRFPRLYLPFFGIAKAIGATIIVVSAIALGLYLELPLTAALPWSVFLAGIAVLSAITSGLLYWGVKASPPMTWDPIEDIRSHGFLGSMLPYITAERTDPRLVPPLKNIGPATRNVSPLPHLVAVQSESYFDPRGWCSLIRPDLLGQIDTLKDAAAIHGQLRVPAWGANTVRTEFAVLSGLSPAQIGVHRFNPYRKLAAWSPFTLATLLQSHGYKTICIHPYPAEFYKRNKIFPLFGFDQFIDIQSFASNEKSGPYIGDLTLGETICAELRRSTNQPVFLFVITMENHGPLHWEKPFAHECNQYCTQALPQGCDDLLIYLRHLRNADTMAGMIAQALQSLERKAWLCWYGDHVPIMPAVYRTFGNPSGETDYFLWSNREEQRVGQHMDLRAEQLAVQLLAKMGLMEQQGDLPAPRRPEIARQNA